MSKRDDYLEEKLSEHELGAESRNYLLGDFDSGEESVLVNMANTIRDLDHPEQDYETMQSEKRKIISAARERFPAKRGLRTVLNGRFKGQWLFASATAGAALILLMAFVLATGVGLYFAGPRGAQAATLVDGTGLLEVSDTGFSGDWYSITSGDTVKSGQRLRTGADSGVTLVFFEGTQATLGPNTDLVLSKIDGDWGNELQVEIIQNGGETDHQVIPLQGENASYQVLTPSGSATVKGTSFSVLVDDTGLSLFTVDTGEVLVMNEGGETSVAAGQGLVTDLGEPLDTPTFLFTLQGELVDNVGPTWVVDTVEIMIEDGTRIFGDPQEGDIVLVNGHITNDNDWVAHTIDIAFTDGEGGTFTGVVTAVGTGELEINNISFAYGDGQPPVEVGDKVRVTFVIVDNTWVIESIIPLEDAHIPDDDNGDDDEPDLEGDLFFQPDKHKVSACEAEAEAAREFMTTLNFVKVDDSQTSIDVLLDYMITEGAEFVAAVELSANDVVVVPGTDVVQVADGTPVNIKVKITLNPDYPQLPPEEEIKVKVIGLEPDSKDLITNYFVVKWECDEELPDEEDDEKDGNYCTTDAIHPHAAQLEAAYSDLEPFGATYDNIMMWFCEFNLGFGEIEQAFKLFRLYREELLFLDPTYMIQDIIDMRLTGLGWGQVKKDMAGLAKEAVLDGEVEPAAKKEPPGKSKSEDAKNKEKPDKKKKDD